MNFTLLFILAIYLARFACRTELTRYFDRISAEMKQVKLVWSIQLLCGKFRGRCCCVTSGLTLTIILVIFIPIGDLLMRPTLIDSSGWALNPECYYLDCLNTVVLLLVTPVLEGRMSKGQQKIERS